MKYVLLFLFILYLILKPPAKPQIECDLKSVFQAIPPVVWYEQTIDGIDQPPIVTRFFHNKANIFTSQLFKCYASKLDPLEVFKVIGLLGFMFWLYFVWKIILKKMWLWTSLFLTIPMLLITTNNTQLMHYPYIFFAIVGAAFAVFEST